MWESVEGVGKYVGVWESMGGGMGTCEGGMEKRVGVWVEVWESGGRWREVWGNVLGCEERCAGGWGSRE